MQLLRLILQASGRPALRVLFIRGMLLAASFLLYPVRAEENPEKDLEDVPAYVDTAENADTTEDDTSAGSDSSRYIDDSLDLHSNTVAGFGAGVSLGSNPVFKHWQNGLPRSLADFGLIPKFLAQGNDTSVLLFTVKENPEIYNFTFPVIVSVNRLSPARRYGASAAFSWISKNYTSSISIGADSLGRRIDISQYLRQYAVTIDVYYGLPIARRYFTVDGVGRTDILIGVSATPYLFLKKGSRIAGPSDPRLSAAGDSVAAHLNAFSSSGIAFGGRAGMATVRSLSKSSGLEVGLSYSINWCTRFSAGGARLTETMVSPTGISSKEVSYFSNRIEITFALLRKLGKDDTRTEDTRTKTPAAMPEP